MVQNPDAAVISERWSEVLTHRPFWQWSSVALVIRLTPFMVALGFVAATIGALDSEAVGGLMVAGYVLANFIAPINGRIHDHFGPARSLPWQLALGSLAFLALTIAVQQRWPAGALVALAAACGLITAGMSGALRATLGEFIPGGRIQRALAIDAFFTELAVVIAPLIVLVATLQVFWGGIAVMALFTGSGAIGAIWLRNRVRGVAVSPVAHDRVQLPGADDRSLWTNPQFILWVLVSVSFGQVLGTLETGALPITIRYGMDSIWAVMLIAVAASLSVALGVLYASVAERLRWPEPLQAMVMLLAMAIGCFCLAIPNAWGRDRHRRGPDRCLHVPGQHHPPDSDGTNGLAVPESRGVRGTVCRQRRRLRTGWVVAGGHAARLDAGRWRHDIAAVDRVLAPDRTSRGRAIWPSGGTRLIAFRNRCEVSHALAPELGAILDTIVLDIAEDAMGQLKHGPVIGRRQLEPHEKEFAAHAEVSGVPENLHWAEE